MNDHKYFSFSTCFRLLEEANLEMKTKFNDYDYTDILRASEQKNRKMHIIIDLDLVIDPYTRRVRNQFYEASHLFVQSGMEVVVFTKKEEGYFRDGNVHAFTKIFYEMIMNDEEKSDFFHKYTMSHMNDCFFIFADTMAPLLKPINCIVSLNTIGTNYLTFNQDQSPLTKYSVVEYLMFFLSLTVHINKIYKVIDPQNES